MTRFCTVDGDDGGAEVDSSGRADSGGEESDVDPLMAEVAEFFNAVFSVGWAVGCCFNDVAAGVDSL